MVESIELVKDAEGTAWEITMILMETLEEAVEVYGAEGALSLLNSGLKIRKQAIARANFKAGKLREEVEQLISEYRPGQSTKKSKKTLACAAIMDNALRLEDDSELKAAVTEAFTSNKWGDVLDLLGPAEE